jgi:hypothetical protein
MQTEPNDIWTPELAEVSNENALCEFYSLAVGSSRRKRKDTYRTSPPRAVKNFKSDRVARDVLTKVKIS